MTASASLHTGELEKALRRLEKERDDLRRQVEELIDSRDQMEANIALKNREIRELKTQCTEGLERRRLDRMRKERQEEVRKRKVNSKVESLLMNQE